MWSDKENTGNLNIELEWVPCPFLGLGTALLPCTGVILCGVNASIDTTDKAGAREGGKQLSIDKTV